MMISRKEVRLKGRGANIIGSKINTPIKPDKCEQKLYNSHTALVSVELFI